jgi:hypothetical protein
MTYRCHNEAINGRERYSRLARSCFTERTPHILFKDLFEKGGTVAMFWRALTGEDEFGKSEGERWGIKPGAFFVSNCGGMQGSGA